MCQQETVAEKVCQNFGSALRQIVSVSLFIVHTGKIQEPGVHSLDIPNKKTKKTPKTL